MHSQLTFKQRAEVFGGQAKASARFARELAELAHAEDRDLTTAEKKLFDQHIAAAEAFRAKADQAAKDHETMAEIDRIADWITGGPTHSKASSLWASEVVDRLGGVGMKSLLQGQVSTPTPLPIAELPEQPRRILDLVPREPIQTHDFSWLVQVKRDSKARPVPDFAQKPRSEFTFAERRDQCKTIAHLSEAFPVRYLSDHGQLLRILNDQMLAGIYASIEDEIIYGSGGDEHFTGLLETEGTTSIPFADDLLTSCRKARTALEVLGEIPTAWALSPEDVETIDLLRELGDSGGGFLVDSAAAETVFGPYPRVSAPSLPPGVAILGDWTQSELLIREDGAVLGASQGVTSADDSSGEQMLNLFERNLVLLRAEGRYGFRVFRPQAFAIVELYPSSS